MPLDVATVLQDPEVMRDLEIWLKAEKRPDGSSYAQGDQPTTEALQRYLKDKGFYAGRVDNVFGRNSKHALQAWLKEEGLYEGKLDSIVGKNTSAGLRSFLHQHRPSVAPSIPARPLGTHAHSYASIRPSEPVTTPSVSAAPVDKKPSVDPFASMRPHHLSVGPLRKDFIAAQEACEEPPIGQMLYGHTQSYFGTHYDFYNKNGGLNCSTLVNRVALKAMADANKLAGKELYNMDEMKTIMAPSAQNQIVSISRALGQKPQGVNARNLSADSLQEGTVIGVRYGNAPKDGRLHITHSVILSKDAKGNLMVSESAVHSGAHAIPIEKWMHIQRKDGATLFAVNPFKLRADKLASSAPSPVAAAQKASTIRKTGFRVASLMTPGPRF